MIARWLCCGAAVVSLLAGCGRTRPPEPLDSGLDAPDSDADSEAPDSGPGEIAFEAYCEGMARAYADFLADCFGSPLGFYDAADWESWRDICARFSPGIEAGSVVYDGTAAAACVRALEEEAAGFCPDLVFFADTPECEGIVRGTVLGGGECFADFFTTGLVGSECAEGYCRTEPDCPGTCVPFQREGQDCNTPARLLCAEGLRCDSGTCRLRADEGEMCGGGCLDGLVCLPDGAPTAVCVRLAPVGDPCSTSVDCGGPAVCDDGTCRAKVDRNGPCVLYLNCPEGQSCLDLDGIGGDDGTCVNRGEAGSLCALDGDCTDDHVCSAAACAIRPMIGEDCSARLCRPGDWCRTETVGSPLCAALGRELDMCTDGLGVPGPFVGSCETGLWCMDDGRCHMRGDLGELCRSDGPTGCTGTDLWCAATGLCERRVERGVMCIDDAQCLSGNCPAGTCDFSRTCFRE